MLFCFHRSLYKKCWKQQILKQWKPSDIFTIINENRKLKYKMEKRENEKRREQVKKKRANKEKESK